MTEPSPNKKPKQPSENYDRLLKGEITSKQYVKTLKKQAQSGRYVSRRASKGGAVAAFRRASA